MRVASGQNPAPQILQRRMLGNALHQPLAEPASAVRFQHEHIADIRDGSEVADHAGETDLRALPIINAETKRVLDRPGHDFPGDALGPIAIGQKTVNHIQTQALTVGTDQELAPPVLHHSFGIEDAPRHAHILPLDRYSNAVRRNEASCHPSM